MIGRSAAPPVGESRASGLASRSATRSARSSAASPDVVALAVNRISTLGAIRLLAKEVYTGDCEAVNSRPISSQVSS
jgi:hypothetical protein